jgi:Tol biopolymer transport system component
MMRRFVATVVGVVSAALSTSCDKPAPTEPSVPRQLLLRSRMTLDVYVINDDGTGQARIVDGTALQTERAIWSPDGSRILLLAAERAQTDFYLVNADGSGQARITNDAAIEASPSWDGRTIVFTRTIAVGAARVTHVFAVSADGTGLRDVTPGNAFAEEPALSPDGRTVAFIGRDAANATPRLETIDLVTGVRRTLITAPNEQSSVGSPRFSPDGNTIAFFQSIVARGVLESGTWLVGVSGAGARSVATGLGFTATAEPWSTDGKTLVLGGESLYLVDAATGARTLIVSSTLAGSAYGRSPDGTDLVYTRTVGSVGPSAWVATISGTNVRRLSADWLADPAWRPTPR